MKRIFKLRASMLLPLLLMVGCSSSRHNLLAERTIYWQQSIQSEIPVGSKLNAVQDWARVKSLTLTDMHGSSLALKDPPGIAFAIGLESVPVSSLFCKGFGLSLFLRFTQDGVVSSEEINTFGNCV